MCFQTSKSLDSCQILVLGSIQAIIAWVSAKHFPATLLFVLLCVIDFD